MSWFVELTGSPDDVQRQLTDAADRTQAIDAQDGALPHIAKGHQLQITAVQMVLDTQEEGQYSGHVGGTVHADGTRALNISAQFRPAQPVPAPVLTIPANALPS